MQWNEFRPHARHLSTKDLERVKSAFELGKKLHEGQLRKSGDAYFSHPIAVAHMLTAMRADADTIIAALLHDTVEDTNITLEEIDALFQGTVRSLIDGLTKLSPEEIGEKITLNEQVETLRKMFTLMEQDIRIMVIKLCDRLHNMQTVKFLSRQNQEALAGETLDVYVKIADRLCMQDLRDELEELCLAVLRRETFPALSILRRKNEQSGQSVLKKIRKRMQEAFPAVHCEVTYEHPSWDKLQSQVEKGNIAVTGLSALTAVYVCADLDTCYQVMGVLHQLWKREVMSFQDFINTPQINGYKGLHTTIILEDGTRVRCKIRTDAMHEYARKGITTQCFSDTSTGLLTILPWTTRISPLAQSTSERSKEFWESLQSDILGESIVIHGPADQVMQLPRGATALDGAFYLFGEETFFVSQIKINGQQVHFRSPLTHGDSLDVVLGQNSAVDREWLQWVHTGFAAAKIRNALTLGQTEEEKLGIGKAMLQTIMQDRKRGFVEEFREEGILPGLRTLGLPSLNHAFIAIADGRLEPEEVYDAMFEKSKAPNNKKMITCRVRYNVDMDDVEVMDRVNLVHRQFGATLEEVHYRRSPRGEVRLKLKLSPSEQTVLQHALRVAGAKNITITFHRQRTWYFTAIVFLLWGLDPVVARLLINAHNLSSLDLSLVRFISLAGMSGLLFFWQRSTRQFSETRLPLRNKSLWISAILLVGVSFTTYHSLKTTFPLHYTIPMTAAGLLLTTIVNKHRWKTLILTWTCLLIAMMLLIISTSSWPLEGILFTLFAVISFTAFSVVSEKYKRAELIGTRAAQYFFHLSLICLILTLPLLPFSTLGQHSMSTLVQMALFSILFAGMPYYIYYYLLSHKQIDFVLRFSFIIILTTGLGQILFPQSGMLTLVTLLAGALVILGATLPLFQDKHSSAD